MTHSLTYLVVVSAPMYRLSSSRFAMESAFCAHLRALLRLMAPHVRRLVLAAPGFSPEQYESWKSSLTEVDEKEDAISFVELYPAQASRIDFVKNHQAPALKTVARLIDEADIVHTHLSHDIYRPVEFEAGLLARAKGKALVVVSDIDNRKSAEMNLRAGTWSWREYAACRYLYDPLRDAQHRTFVQIADLLLFKEPQQVRDYSGGKSHVRLFQDPNFQIDNVVKNDVLSTKMAEIQNTGDPLRVCYFGRYVSYKGVDRMIEAVALAHKRGANLRFDLMGMGELEPDLRRAVDAAGLSGIVTWHTPRPYGEPLFEWLRAEHVLLAAPLSGDTPRSTWDAIASGMALVAFDTPFYCGMRDQTGAVVTVPWLDTTAMADAIVALANERQRVVEMVKRGADVARHNTHDDWLNRRVEWTLDILRRRGLIDDAPSPR